MVLLAEEILGYTINGNTKKVLVNEKGSLTNSTVLSGKQVESDKTATWANNTAANTPVNIDFTKPDLTLGEYMLTLYNPSTVTSITVKIYTKALNLGGQDRYSLITQLSFPANECQSKYIHGIFCGESVRFVLSNDINLGIADGFTATLRLREV